MAYPIAEEVLKLFTDQYRQIARITVDPIEGERVTLTEEDIISQGLTIDRYCVSGSRIEIGSAVAAELTLALDNKDGRFDDFVFEGAELFVEIGIKKWDAANWENATVHYIPMGYFTVDTPPRKLSTITLNALDRMVMFDRLCESSDFVFPCTVGTMLSDICTKCGVSLATSPANLCNYDYTIRAFPEGTELTFRQLLMWIAEITGTCAYIDWGGHLRLEWYDSSKIAAEIKPNMRFSSDLNDKSVTLTGVQIETEDGESYVQGTNEYALCIQNNGLIQDHFNEVAYNLFQNIDSFTYTPYSCVTKPLIHLYPLDYVVFIDKSGNRKASIVTNVTFTMNANLSLAGKGETETLNSYAQANPLTKHEAAIIAKMDTITRDRITEREQYLIEMNQAIANSLGLYMTAESQVDGSYIYYWHDQPLMTGSHIIYRFSSGGFAWTDHWEGAGTVWKYGITAGGNAILNLLSVYKISADQIQAGSITANRLAVNVVTSDNFEQQLIAAGGVLQSTLTNFENGVNSNITQLSNKISLVVSNNGDTPSVNVANIVTAINANGNSSIKLSANQINLTAYPTKNDLSLSVTNNETDADIALRCGNDVIGSANICLTGLVSFSDLENTGSTTINGANITTGIISANRIDTLNLSCSKLTEWRRPNGYYATINGNWGDFGIFKHTANNGTSVTDGKCVFGVYQSDQNGGLHFYSYGDEFLRYSPQDQKTYPMGEWDFQYATLSNLSGNLTATAVFG